MELDYGTILSIILTLAIFSYVYKETLLFRIAEHMFLGVSLGHGIVVAWKYTVDNAWTPMMNGNITMIVGFVFGVIMLLFLSKRAEWVSRWSVALMTGSIMGLGVRALISVNLVNQIIGTIKPLTLQADPFAMLNAIVILIATITSLAYFTFTFKHKGALGITTRVGRIFLMLALGGYFGQTVMSRLTLLSGRILYLLQAFGLMPS